MGDIRKSTGCFGALAALLLVSCSSNPPATDGADFESPADNMRGAADRSAAPADLPYIAVNAVADPLTPLGPTFGRLEVQDGCVVFRFRGGVTTPLWPEGTSIRNQASDGFLIVGPAGRFDVPSQATLGGAVMAPGERSGYPAEPLAGGCPRNLYVISEEQ